MKVVFNPFTGKLDWVETDHTKFSNIGLLDHATIDSYLNQAVKTTSSPTFAGGTFNGAVDISVISGTPLTVTAPNSTNTIMVNYQAENEDKLQFNTTSNDNGWVNLDNQQKTAVLNFGTLIKAGTYGGSYFRAYGTESWLAGAGNLHFNITRSANLSFNQHPVMQMYLKMEGGGSSVKTVLSDDYGNPSLSNTNLFAGKTNTQTLGVKNGTAPSSNITDAFQLYSADISAGKASPHFRNEAGDIIKLYKETALTTQLTTITHTAPGTPDYAIQDFTQTVPWGFASHDEANSVLKVIANLQTRVSELETKLQNQGLLT